MMRYDFKGQKRPVARNENVYKCILMEELK